jgi:hypothetical protein
MVLAGTTSLSEELEAAFDIISRGVGKIVVEGIYLGEDRFPKGSSGTSLIIGGGPLLGVELEKIIIR